jgi:class 3 adenylate cyclase/tetratricopeptide (TPR) repeat protein
LAVFVFVELVEASATLAALGEARNERSSRAYREVTRSAAAAAKGRGVSAAGDGALVAFDSASDALAFARAVIRGCERESRRLPERLDIRLGIDVGEIADVDGESAVSSAAAAVRAQALARSAETGSVLASSTVSALASGSTVRFRPVGLLNLPDASEPVSAVEVEVEPLAAVQLPLPPELDAFGPRTTFVGRSGERERLRSLWRWAQSGGPQPGFVVGEPGIGKTRLVAEFAREVHDGGAAVLWGRSSEEALIPYQPFVQALQHHVRSASPDELRDQLGFGGAVLARLLPELVERLGLPPPAREESESERFRLFAAVVQLLGALGSERPLLVVLDDLQWADPGTLLLLKHLARDPTPMPLLVLGTYRHSEVGADHALALALADIERDRVIERIELTGLGEDETAELVTGLIGWQPPDEVVRGLRGETDGNPFFLEEVIRHLEQLGLSGDPERLARVKATVEELGVPARVRELVARRVQRLSPAARAALANAAVIGSEFDRDVLAAVTCPSNERELDQPLDDAVQARLLEESPARIGRYGFSHALIQQALYEQQTLNRRAALHEQAATALERLRPDEPGLHGELAYHYARAGDRYAAKVVEHARAGGEHALALLAYEDAIAAFSTALTALEKTTIENAVARAELLTLLGTALWRAGNAPKALETFHDAALLSGTQAEWRTLARAALGYGGGAGFGGVWERFAVVDDELVRLLEQALAAAPVESLEHVRLLGRLAQALYWAPENERALQLSEQALSTARRLDDEAALAYALDSRHVALWGPDHLDERRALGEEMLSLAHRLGDPDIQLEALAWLATDDLERGSIAAVDELIATHARLAEELRQPYYLWYTDALRAMRAHLDGRFEDAGMLAQQAFAVGEQAHGANALQTYLVQTLFVKLDLGELDELMEQLAAYVAESPLTAWRGALALAYAGLDRREEALEQVAWFAEHGFDSIRRDCVWPTTVVALARTVAHFDDPTHADELYALLAPFADRICVVGGAVLCLGPISRILGMLARTAGRPGQALWHFADALERSQALGSPPLIARTKLEAAKAHLLRHTADDAAVADRLLAEAREIAAGAGMTKLLHDVEALRAPLGTTA